MAGVSSWAQNAALALAAVVVLAVIGAVKLMGVGYVRAFEYWRKYQSVRYPRALVSDLIPCGVDGFKIRNPLKPGDILLFIPSAHGFFNSMLTEDVFSHSAMIVEVDGVLHTSEATQGTELGPAGSAAKGAGLVPLLARLKYYSGTPHVMQLDRPLTSPQLAALGAAARLSYPYPSLPQVFLGVAGGRPPARHCFQHVAFLLHAIGLADLRDAGFAGVSRRVSGLSGVPLAGGASYAPILQLLYDVDASEGC